MTSAEASVSRDQVLAALSKVQEPELHKDLVTLDMIKELTIDAGRVEFTVQLTTPACPLRGKIESDARKAVAVIPGVDEVVVHLDANVPTDGRMRGLIRLP